MKKAKRRFTYYGEEAATPLVRWLNDGGDKLPTIVNLLKFAHKYHDAKDPKVKHLYMTQVDSILLDFRFAPVIAEMNDRWTIAWGYAGQPGVREQPEVREQAMAILFLLDLAEMGVWRNLKRCEKSDCQKWFFARFGHQRYCSDECRIAVLQHDPARKKQRAEQMRKLRHDEKIRRKKGGK
jgi:hypothetical protein